LKVFFAKGSQNKMMAKNEVRDHNHTSFKMHDLVDDSLVKDKG
jgi:hypothetical protein